MRDADDAMRFTIADDSGYLLTADDLAFLNLSMDDVERLCAKTAPLGMSEAEYLPFVEDLKWSLSRYGVTDFDIRLQGSSATGFSGSHKLMPFSRTEVARTMAESQGRTPPTVALERVLAKLRNQWPSQSRPRRRPFDSMRVLGVELSPSDYDVQISSDQMIEQLREELRRLKVDPAEMRIKNDKYAFVEKHYAERCFAQVRDWSLDYSELMGRPVNWALFSSTGPDLYADDPSLSSHFRPTDWIIVRAVRREQLAADSTLTPEGQ